MNRYTLTKAAEEACEMAQASLKYELRPDAKSLAALVGELADTQAFIRIMVAKLPPEQIKAFTKLTKARMRREEKKGKIRD